MENETNTVTEDNTGTGTVETTTEPTTVEPVEPTNVIITDPTTGEPADGITQDEWNLLQETINKIQENTVPFVPDPSAPPTGMTFEQAQQLIDVMSNVDKGLYFLVIFVAAFFIWQIFKVLYQFIGGIIFGRL
jgi:hypothetical protein